MGALGYSKNTLPFLELARRVPLAVLESLAQSGISDEESLMRQQALLLGTAGLLPPQRPQRQRSDRTENLWAVKLERHWVGSGHDGTMPAESWDLCKIRPNNSPLRRLAAMSELVFRYRETGLMNGLLGLVKAAPLSDGHNCLEKGLLVAGAGYRANHFGLISQNRVRSPALLGTGRAADINVNVLLPFTLAWSLFNCQPELGDKALALYCAYPRLMANSIERHMMAQLGLARGLVNSARRQQGLLHIYRTLCTQGRCQDCSLKPASFPAPRPGRVLPACLPGSGSNRRRQS